jgi:dolichol-phosphate mannosyltransferase
LRRADPVVWFEVEGGREKGAIKPLNFVGNILLTMLANILYRSDISDLCTGCWGMRGEIVPTLNLSANGFQFEADLYSQIARRHYRIGEVPIFYRRRPTRPKLGSFRDGARIADAPIQEIQPRDK